MKLIEIKLPDYKIINVISTLSQVNGWGIKQLNVPNTWKITKGENIRIMVLDTGTLFHIDLIDGIEKDLCKSFIDTEPEIEDKNFHGGHVMGIIGARNNSTGMVGVAPESRLIGVKVLNKDGTGTFESIIKGLKYAIEIKPDIVSMSLGTSIYNVEIHNLIKELYNLNIPVVCAAGNDGLDNSVNYPAKFPETIAVGAYDENGQLANFSSKGKELDFVAPGVNIYSTWENNQYAYLQGTSQATPFISGVIALLLAKHRKQELKTGENDCKTVEQIKEHLIKYTTDKGIIGKDDKWGYGIVDVEKLILEYSMPYFDKPIKKPKTSYTLWEKIKIFLGWA